jgi:hypothetical protein
MTCRPAGATAYVPWTRTVSGYGLTCSYVASRLPTLASVLCHNEVSEPTIDHFWEYDRDLISVDGSYRDDEVAVI